MMQQRTTSLTFRSSLLLLALLVLNSSHAFISIAGGGTINTRMTNGLHVHDDVHGNLHVPTALHRQQYISSVELQALPVVQDLHVLVSIPTIDFLDTTSLFQAVEVFDGSTILDPIVVSGVFWSSMKAKILSVIIGQFLATLVFGILAYLLSSQLGNLSDYVAKNVFQDTSTAVVKKNFDDFAQSIKNKSQAPTITPDVRKLILCLIIDIIGASSELIPFVGELTDIAYAPVAALALRSLFQGSNVVFALEFLEEFLPFTDILPLATICWVVETYYGDSDIAKTLQIGLYNNDNRSYYEKTGKVNGVIDIDAKAVDIEVEDVNINESNNRM